MFIPYFNFASSLLHPQRCKQLFRPDVDEPSKRHLHEISKDIPLKAAPNSEMTPV